MINLPSPVYSFSETNIYCSCNGKFISSCSKKYF